jgi:hypothetical protein
LLSIFSIGGKQQRQENLKLEENGDWKDSDADEVEEDVEGFCSYAYVEDGEIMDSDALHQMPRYESESSENMKVDNEMSSVQRLEIGKKRERHVDLAPSSIDLEKLTPEPLPALPPAAELMASNSSTSAPSSLNDENPAIPNDFLAVPAVDVEFSGFDADDLETSDAAAVGGSGDKDKEGSESEDEEFEMERSTEKLKWKGKGRDIPRTCDDDSVLFERETIEESGGDASPNANLDEREMLTKRKYEGGDLFYKLVKSMSLPPNASSVSFNKYIFVFTFSSSSTWISFMLSH